MRLARPLRAVLLAAALLAAAPPQPAAAADGFEIYDLRAALPGPNGTASTTAADLAALVTQALSPTAADLRVYVAPNGQQLVLMGGPAALAQARALIERLDVAQKLVVLDTQIVEVDENVAKDLGLSLPNPVLSSTFGEIAPPADANGGPGRIGRLQAIGRTPLSLQVQLNLLIRNGSARVLADPRITTVSGRTATIRAGDTISIETTAGGGAGTVATTQLQTFQTGVTLDITPIVNANGFISVTLHPTVNSLTGIFNGIPQISTRDTQTTVALQEDQTLIIGGLIQEQNSRTTSKIPLLGDLPLVGGAFRANQISSNRNELIITVTPHIVVPANAPPGATLAPPSPTPFAPRPPLPHAAQPPAPGRVGAASRAAATARANGAAVAVPAPTPSAYASLNTFTYGSVPQNDFAKPTDPVQIFYATLAPTVIVKNAALTVNAITSSNAQRVTLTYGTLTQSLAQVGQGQWQARFALGSALPPPPATITLTLAAARADGTSTSIAIPVSIAP